MTICPTLLISTSFRRCRKIPSGRRSNGIYRRPISCCARKSDLRKKLDLAYAYLSFWFPGDDRALPART